MMWNLDKMPKKLVFGGEQEEIVVGGLTSLSPIVEETKE